MKLTRKIHPRHNGIIPIKIKGNSITGETVCFISSQESRKGKDPNINIMSGSHNIKGRTTVNILVSNYSNKHVMFSKEEYIGHLENINEEDNSQPHDHSDAYTTSSVTTKRMMSEQVKLDPFEPPCHELKPNIQKRLEALLKEYKSKFTQDETSIGTTPLTSSSIFSGTHDRNIERFQLHHCISR